MPRAMKFTSPKRSSHWREKLAPGVPVVVFSADRELRGGNRKPEVDAALNKPFDLEQLQDVVERLVRPRPAA